MFILLCRFADAALSQTGSRLQPETNCKNLWTPCGWLCLPGFAITNELGGIRTPIKFAWLGFANFQKGSDKSYCPWKLISRNTAGLLWTHWSVHSYSIFWTQRYSYKTIKSADKGIGHFFRQPSGEIVKYEYIIKKLMNGTYFFNVMFWIEIFVLSKTWHFEL